MASKKYEILLGIDQKMDFEFRGYVFFSGFTFFDTSTPKAHGAYREYTPHNIGNLWKVRYYAGGYFKVFFGTKEVAYCTSLADCLKITGKSLNNSK